MTDTRSHVFSVAPGAPRRVALMPAPAEVTPPELQIVVGKDKRVLGKGSATEKDAIQSASYFNASLADAKYDGSGSLIVPKLPDKVEHSKFTIECIPELKTKPYAGLKKAIVKICAYYIPALQHPTRRGRSSPCYRGILTEKKSPGITKWKEKLVAELDWHDVNGLRSNFRHSVFRVIQEHFHYVNIDNVKKQFPGKRKYEKSCKK